MTYSNYDIMDDIIYDIIGNFRKRNSFVENSIVGGNGVLYAMVVARALMLDRSLPVTD
jgi:hypothetical protein